METGAVEPMAADEAAVDDRAAPVIEVEGLRHVYRQGSAPAVQDMAFSVAGGEVFGLLGPSGAGKSTTQRVLVRLLRGWEGAVRVFGRDLRRWDDGYFERVGVGFELPNHHTKLTARENLRFFASLYRQPTDDPDELLAAVGLADAADRRVGGFSKGMAVRLNLARALLPRPDLLFLDEPTSGLDPVNTRLVVDLVEERRRRGCTVFLTTHDMALADELCDRVGFVVDGRLALVGVPRDLRLAHGERTVEVETTSHGGRSARHRFALEGIGEDERFLALLRSGTVETIHTAEATLADVFVATTGRVLP